MTEQTKFKVSQVWEDRRGELNKIINVGENVLCVQGCSANYDTSGREVFYPGREVFYHSLDGKYDCTGSTYFDLVKLVYDPIINGSSITEKIQQIEQQLQELKALLKD